MAEEAIAGHGDEARLAIAGGGEDAFGGLVHRLDIAAIDGDTIEPKGDGALVQIGVGGGAVDARSHAILIIDAAEDDRQFPQRRHVHGFIENALLRCAVAKKGDRDILETAIAIRHAGADGMRNAAADDGW